MNTDPEMAMQRLARAAGAATMSAYWLGFADAARVVADKLDESEAADAAAHFRELADDALRNAANYEAAVGVRP